jgi:hypothetical protein
MESKAPFTDITADVTGRTNQADTFMVGDKTVVKRNGEIQTLDPEKIRVRLEKLLEGLVSKHINLDLIIGKTVSYSQNGKYTLTNLIQA